jgi:hypothetical protein
VAEPTRLDKGFRVEANPESYVMNLIQLIRHAQEASPGTPASLPEWGLGSAEYEIVR